MKEVEMVMATPWKPYLEVEQSVKLGQILTAVNGGNSSMSEVVSNNGPVSAQRRIKKGNRELKGGVPLVVMPSSLVPKSRRKKFRKYKRKSKKSKTVETKPPTTPDVRSSQKENPVEMQQPTTPISSPQLSTEIRLAALKALLLQAKDRETSSK